MGDKWDCKFPYAQFCVHDDSSIFFWLPISNLELIKYIDDPLFLVPYVFFLNQMLHLGQMVRALIMVLEFWLKFLVEKLTNQMNTRVIPCIAT